MRTDINVTENRKAAEKNQQVDIKKILQLI